MTDEGCELSPEERGYLLSSGGPPPPAIASGRSLTPSPTHRPIRTVDAGDLVRTALGLLIGVVSTGIEAALAELTARRGTQSGRH